MLKFINITIGLVMCLALWLLFFADFSADTNQDAKEANHLKKFIPQSPDNWTSNELELASTEEAKRAAEKILGASEYLNREYRSPDGSKSFILYIAYWQKGKANGRVVSDHTPDKCWVLNGWKNDKSKARSDYKFNLDNLELIPAFYRRMTFDNMSQTIVRFVCFWHMMDGKRYEYGDSASTFNAFTFNHLKNSILTLFSGAPEQYFIRVDSSIDFSDLMEEKAFREVIESLANFGIEQKVKETK